MAKRVRDGDGAPRSANFRKRDAESDFPRSRDGIIVDGPFSGICSPGIAKNGGRQRSILFSLKILNIKSKRFLRGFDPGPHRGDKRPQTEDHAGEPT